MRAVRHFLLPIAAAAVVAACGGEGSSNTSPSSSGPRAGNPSMQPQRTAQMPVLERSSSLRGTDADGNGVRDDIDAFIHSSVKDPARKDAVLQLARSKHDMQALGSGFHPKRFLFGKNLCAFAKKCRFLCYRAVT